MTKLTSEELSAVRIALISSIRRDKASLEIALKRNDEWGIDFFGEEVRVAESALDKLREWF